MHRHILLLAFLTLHTLWVGFTAAQVDVGKCADGSEGLTDAVNKAGNASTATCVPENAFYGYEGDVELTGDDCKSLVRIERSAFRYMSGKLTIHCTLGKLTHVGGYAFHDASNTASSVTLSSALLLEDISDYAFQLFKGAITISGRFRALTEIGHGALHSASNPANSIRIACSSPGGLTVQEFAFYDYEGTHYDRREGMPCIDDSTTTSTSTATGTTATQTFCKEGERYVATGSPSVKGSCVACGAGEYQTETRHQFETCKTCGPLECTTGQHLTLKGMPTRTDSIVLDENAGPLLTELAGATVLDTGLTITPAVCNITGAASKLASYLFKMFEFFPLPDASPKSGVARL